VLEAVRAEHPERRWRCSATAWAARGGGVPRGPPPASRRGGGTSGAALAVGPGVSRRFAAARLLRRVAPRLALGSGLDPQGLSRDPEVVRAYLADSLVYRP
jgi:hypothetical protein